MARGLGCGAVLLLSVGVLAACGGSGHFTSAERAAITAAKRDNGWLRIFPDRPGTISCRISVGGPVTGFENGHCTTHVFVNRHRTRLDFVEQTHPGPGGSGGWTVILDRHNRILSDHFYGAVPQLQL